MKKLYKVKTDFGEYEVELRAMEYYANKNLAIEMFSPTEGPFARLTVNLGDKLKDGFAYVDTNNCPWAEDFIVENGLGKDTGVIGRSGYCMYPLYEFNMEVL